MVYSLGQGVERNMRLWLELLLELLNCRILFSKYCDVNFPIYVCQDRVHRGSFLILGKGKCNITIIPSLIDSCVDIMRGYDESYVTCKLYLYVLIIKCDANC
jgi:hypothetical protein